ncbi:hypothetical protein [Paenibacillus agaridevorans]|uniref:hypothetical protein n=1 Tax=Paenibacillus agaridevorans TaxID=171404 RepID=UPI001BE416B1|nr:hypothetical protein [Paenibacillus agaridevorans]
MKRRNTMDKPWRKELMICATAFMLLLAGCQSAKPDQQNGNDDNVVIAEEVTSDGPQKSYLEDADPRTVGSDAPSGNLSGTDDGSSAETSSAKKGGGTADPGSGQQDGTKWNKSVPALHGIAIGDGVSAVTTLLGKELDSYLLEEESSQIHVHEYEGVSVGFSGKGAVHFVEVFGLDAATGLNGLKIGDKPEQAIKKLGQPEVQSEYHLTYEAKKARLKLDIDPGRNEIVSMKLIAAS